MWRDHCLVSVKRYRIDKNWLTFVVSINCWNFTCNDYLILIFLLFVNLFFFNRLCLHVSFLFPLFISLMWVKPVARAYFKSPSIGESYDGVSQPLWVFPFASHVYVLVDKWRQFSGFLKFIQIMFEWKVAIEVTSIVMKLLPPNATLSPPKRK